MTNPTPTQTAPDAVREVLDGLLCDCDFAKRLPTVNEILAAIAAAGFTIAEPGMVTVSLEDVGTAYDATIQRAQEVTNPEPKQRYRECADRLYDLLIPPKAALDLIRAHTTEAPQ